MKNICFFLLAVAYGQCVFALENQPANELKSVPVGETSSQADIPTKENTKSVASETPQHIVDILAQANVYYGSYQGTDENTKGTSTLGAQAGVSAYFPVWRNIFNSNQWDLIVGPAFMAGNSTQMKTEYHRSGKLSYFEIGVDAGLRYQSVSRLSSLYFTLKSLHGVNDSIRVEVRNSSDESYTFTQTVKEHNDFSINAAWAGSIGENFMLGVSISTGPGHYTYDGAFSPNGRVSIIPQTIDYHNTTFGFIVGFTF